EVKRDYERGRIHPLDLKESVTKYLIEILKPVREYFEKNASARRTLEFIKSVKITR
ncbi:MAG: tyrosine--tRNA ligase, partial [Thermoprotei archaeon]